MTLEEIRTLLALRFPHPTLIAVSKMRSADAIRPLLEEGLKHFGENYVQEAAQKWPDLRGHAPEVHLHLIGPLQTNKVRAAFGLFETFHTLDRLTLAQKIASEAQKQGRCPQLFVQVNTGYEPQKAGVFPEDLTDFLNACRQMDLPVMGLMAIPPAEVPAAPHFAQLRRLAEAAELPYLSMGMSRDFCKALDHGATHIRLGEALFGPRTRSF